MLDGTASRGAVRGSVRASVHAFVCSWLCALGWRALEGLGWRLWREVMEPMPYFRSWGAAR
jgi:hypothetical protein